MMERHNYNLGRDLVFPFFFFPSPLRYFWIFGFVEAFAVPPLVATTLECGVEKRVPLAEPILLLGPFSGVQ